MTQLEEENARLRRIIFKLNRHYGGVMGWMLARDQDFWDKHPEHYEQLIQIPWKILKEEPLHED